ncbi:MAG: phage holin family protein [Endomicrobium sp.]|jgi:putative membrane protein|nr:phage holin family protein [Endomicrobium sp.]
MLARFILNIAALLVAVNVVPGINIPSWGVLIASVIVLSLLNAVLKPVLVLLTLPINILTLGLFILFINAFMFYLASEIIKDFRVDSFSDAFFGALIFTIVSALLNYIITGSRKEKRNK